jgi:hypothetical protein
MSRTFQHPKGSGRLRSTDERVISPPPPFLGLRGDGGNDDNGQDGTTCQPFLVLPNQVTVGSS